MAGLVPAIHIFFAIKNVDARHKAGHDDDDWAAETHLPFLVVE